MLLGVVKLHHARTSPRSVPAIQMKTQLYDLSRLFRLALGLGIALSSTTSFGQTNHERLQVAAPPWLADAYFGYGVAMSSNRVLISAPGPLDPYSGLPQGGRARKVLVHDATTGLLLRQLEASDGEVEDGFGFTIAAEGDTVVIGAPWDDDLGLDSGSAYLFDLPSGQELAKLHAAGGDEGDHFGGPVATDGSLALIGAPGDSVNGANTGAAFVFDVATGQQLFRLEAPGVTPQARFGSAVAIGNGLAVVGLHPTPLSGSGSQAAVYVFDATTGQLLHELLPVYADPGTGFGRAVAISGSSILVGNPSLLGGTATTRNGAVHVFDSVTGQWLRDLSGPLVDEPDGFGSTLATDGALVAVGAPWSRVGFPIDGAVYVVDPVTAAVRARLTSSVPTESPSWSDGPGYIGVGLGGALAFDGGSIVAAGTVCCSTGEGTCLVFDDVAVNSGDAYCFGDGSGPSCPCGADGYLGEGCASSVGRGGYLLGAGNASLANDELRLQALRLPAATPVVLFQGSTPTSRVFGEGILCAHPSFRYDVQFSSSVGTAAGGFTGAAVFEGLGQHASPGSTLYYQCWYRDAASACGLGGFNLTNGWAVTW